MDTVFTKRNSKLATFGCMMGMFIGFYYTQFVFERSSSSVYDPTTNTNYNQESHQIDVNDNNNDNNENGDSTPYFLQLLSFVYFDKSHPNQYKEQLQRFCELLTIQMNINPTFNISDIVYWNYYFDNYSKTDFENINHKKLKYIDKIYILKDYLKYIETEYISNNKISQLSKLVICYGDAFDILYLTNKEKILSIYLNQFDESFRKNKVLFNGEYGRWPISKMSKLNSIPSSNPKYESWLRCIVLSLHEQKKKKKKRKRKNPKKNSTFMLQH